MKDITVKDIIKVTKAEMIIGKEDLICENFTRDTRTIKENDTYIALKGNKYDGNEFWEEAIKKGATCVIVQNIEFNKNEFEKYKNVTILKVEDTLKALQQIATFKRSLYNIPVVAITGSVGKTSTKDIIANVVNQKYKTLKTLGNNNNDIGLPFTILNLRDHEALVVEMGMNHLGEISLLSKIAKPDICVITNIGTSHIGNLGSRENILKAKLEILEGAENPLLIINNDNDLLHKWYLENKDKYRVQTFGIKEKSTINAKNIELKEESSSFIAKTEENEIKIQVPVAGEHFVLNAMSAILAGKSLGISEEKIVEGIKNFELTKKRLDISVLENGTKIINDAYNASLESMTSSLKILSEYKNRKIAILGDMFELGEFSEKLHKEVGKELCKRKTDILIASGENAKFIVEQAIESGMPKENIYYVNDKEEILNIFKKVNKPNDVVLIKASNGMKFYELIDEMK